MNACDGSGDKRLTLSLAVASAPLARRRVTVASRPHTAASCRAVRPSYNRQTHRDRQTAIISVYVCVCMMMPAADLVACGDVRSSIQEQGGGGIVAIDDCQEKGGSSKLLQTDTDITLCVYTMESTCKHEASSALYAGGGGVCSTASRRCCWTG